MNLVIFYQICGLSFVLLSHNVATRRSPEDSHAHLRRSLPARALGAGAGAALPAARGAHPDHPRMDRPVGRPHPQAVPLLHESCAALPAASSRQVAAPGRVLHALAAAAAGNRRAGERAVAARRRAGGTLHGGARRATRAHARRAVVPGVRGLPAAAAHGADLVRAHGVSRHRTLARRPAALRTLQRLRGPLGDRALSAARAALPPLREPDAVTLLNQPGKLRLPRRKSAPRTARRAISRGPRLESAAKACEGERRSWITIERTSSPVPTSSGARRRARIRTGSRRRAPIRRRSTWSATAPRTCCTPTPRRASPSSRTARHWCAPRMRRISCCWGGFAARAACSSICLPGR